MVFIIILTVILSLPIPVIAIKKFINKSIKYKTKTQAKAIDDIFVQEIVNSITNGQTPRIVLAKVCENYQLNKTQIAALSGDSITEGLQSDLFNDSLARGFGNLWDVCENNGAALSPALNQFGLQIRTESELRQELSSAMASAKLSAYVLAGLPFFGIGLASFLGVNSFKWLTTSNMGIFVLIIALLLEVIGIFWVRILTSRIEKSL